jgi:hypothetical protein
MSDDVEQRLDRLTIRGVRPEVRGQVLAAVESELQNALAAPKGHGSPSPGQRPGETGPVQPVLSAQRANGSPNGWPVGPTEEQSLPPSPGRCPGLGERLGLQPTEPLAKPPAAIANADSRWLRRAAMVTAAGLLVGISLNVWVTKSSERRFAQLLGPTPVSKRAMEIAKDIEAITDAQTGQWVYRQFTASRRHGNDAAAYATYCNTVKRLIDELQTVSKDSCHEAIQEDPEMDRGHTRCVGGSAAYCQCRRHLEDRCTA